MPYYLGQQPSAMGDLGALLGAVGAFALGGSKRSQEREAADQQRKLIAAQIGAESARAGEETQMGKYYTEEGQRALSDVAANAPVPLPKQFQQPLAGTLHGQLIQDRALANYYRSIGTKEALAQAKAVEDDATKIQDRIIAEETASKLLATRFSQQKILRTIPQKREFAPKTPKAPAASKDVDLDTYNRAQDALSRSPDPRATAAGAAARAMAAGANPRTVQAIRDLGDYYARKFTDQHPKKKKTASGLDAIKTIMNIPP